MPVITLCLINNISCQETENDFKIKMATGNFKTILGKRNLKLANTNFVRTFIFMITFLKYHFRTYKRNIKL